jgi:histidyl-tRNA synthetase
VYTEPKALKKQMQFASKKGFKSVLIAGENEFREGKAKIKNMTSGEEREIALHQLEEEVSLFLLQ